MLAPGIYRVAHPIFVPSGITLRGTQGSDGSPLSTIEQSGAMGKWGNLLLGVVMNENFRADSVIDSDISISNLRITDESSGILMRMSRDVVVSGVHFVGGGDGSAFLASADTSVTHCLAEATTNAAYDHWDGDTNASVVDLIAHAASGYGILFNAADTDGAPRVASNFTASGNDLSGSGKDQAGIWVAPLGRPGTSQIRETLPLRITLSILRNHSFRRAVLLSQAGVTTSIIVQRNQISGSLGYPPLRVIQEPSSGDAAPKQIFGITVVDNIFSDNKVDAKNGGVVDIRGSHVLVKNNSFVNNQSENGGELPFYRPQ